MTGTLSHYPRWRALNSAGQPVSAARLYVYRAGTTVLANTYTTATLTTPHQNPQIANSAGEWLAFYLDPDAGYDYKFVWQGPTGVQLGAEDNVPASGTGGSGGGGGTGADGDDGLSVAEVTIYQRAASQPATPTGGSFSFLTQSLSAPDGWSGEVPAGSAPLYVSKGVAAADGTTGTDADITWSTPVVMAQDGSSVDIVFKRSATQPATPAPSSGVPATWYTDVDSVPASSDLLWSSVGTRDNASLNWVWQLPIQVEGGPGATGADALLYYIKPTSGTAIKNGSGTLRVEAHWVQGGNDILLSSGSLKLYVGSTEVTVANGYYAGSTGYIGIFDSGDIAGSTVVSLKDGPSGTTYDTITLVDVVDGSTGGVGADGVYGYIESTGPLAWVRSSDQTTWTPAGTTLQFDCTFVQAGADVARVAWVLTRDADGILTGVSGTHSGGDLNGARVTATELGEGTQVMGVRFDYSFSGDLSSVTETALTSLSGADGATGSTGSVGPAGYTLSLTKSHMPVMAWQNGTVVSYSGANGLATLYEGTTDVNATTAYSLVGTNCTGRINTAADTPVVGQPIGYYELLTLSADTGVLTITAVESGNTIVNTCTVSKNYVGYEIFATIASITGAPFQGRMVFLTSTNKLYRYTGTSWTAAVDGADIQANSILTNSIGAGQVTAAKISVTELSALTANAGTINAGILQSFSGGSRFDLNNARVLFNSAPGATGGYVRIQGAGFGPSSNYLDWYGPKPAGQSTDSGIIGALTDAGALYFLKTDGSQFNKRTRGEFEPKAWCNFNGTINGSGAAQTMRDRFNIASVTRIGSAQGSYLVTFTAALANTNYVVLANSAFDSTGTLTNTCAPSTQTTTSFRLYSRRPGDNNLRDGEIISFCIFGSNVVGSSNVAVPTGGYGGGAWGGGNEP
jgi:hypothetical protein